MVETLKHLESIIVEVRHVRLVPVVRSVFVQSKEKVHYIPYFMYLWVCDLKVKMMFNSFILTMVYSIFSTEEFDFWGKEKNTVVFSIQMTYFLCSNN